MRLILSHELKWLAYTVKLAAIILDKAQLSIIKTSLENFLHDDKNFQPTFDNPLAFSNTGKAKIKNIYPTFSRRDDMMGILEILDNAISLSAKTEEKIYQIFYKKLKQDPKWLGNKDKEVLKGKNFDVARRKVIEALEALENNFPSQIPGAVTLEEIKEMKSRGVLN